MVNVFWGPAKLKQKLSDGRVKPYVQDRIDGASYRLAIGEEIYITPSTSETQKIVKSFTRLGEKEGFVIPPGQFGFLLTREWVKVELGEIAFISIRAKKKYLGLVNVSGFHVDPGFNGHLVFAVFNAGPVDVHLRQGEDIFLIWFSDLSDQCKEYRPPGPYHIPTETLNGISGKLHSLADLANDLKSVKTQLTIVYSALTPLVVVSLAAIGWLLTLTSDVNESSRVFEFVIDVKDWIASLI